MTFKKLHPHRSTIEALTEALEARDAYTAGHGTRVAAWSIEIARVLGAPPAEIEILQTGAKLHDLGKVGIPDAILLKAASLTEQERGIVRFHTRIGARILAKVPGLEPLLPVVELHHENFDGSGYPYGLRGEQIPRIVRVADSFDAMVTDRVYQPAYSRDRAIEQILSGSGRAFDPEVVAAFGALIRTGDHSPEFSQSLSDLESVGSLA